MEASSSPFLVPGFIVPVVIGLIGFIAWLIRLESKVNAMDKSMTRMDQSIEQGWEDLDKHRNNEGIHFNQRLATEVERRQSDRFTRIEGDLKEIKDLVKGMAGK